MVLGHLLDPGGGNLDPRAVMLPPQDDAVKDVLVIVAKDRFGGSDLRTVSGHDWRVTRHRPPCNRGLVFEHVVGYQCNA